MAKIIDGSRVITNEGRLSYANVWAPKSINGSEERYGGTFIISKEDEETIKLINEAIDYVIETSLDKFGGKKPNKAAIKLPLRDGDLEKDLDVSPEFANSYFINCKSKSAPQIVDIDGNAIVDESEVYSGCYCRMSITFYAFNVNGNKGIACALGNIQKTRDGKKLGGGKRTAAEDFGTAAEEFFN